MKVKPSRSRAELEAKTPSERSYWNEARGRSFNLVEAAQRLHLYLLGQAGDPTYVETVFKEADAIRYAMSNAIAIRIARFESQRKFSKKA